MFSFTLSTTYQLETILCTIPIIDSRIPTLWSPFQLYCDSNFLTSMLVRSFFVIFSSLFNFTVSCFNMLTFLSSLCYYWCSCIACDHFYFHLVYWILTQKDLSNSMSEFFKVNNHKNCLFFPPFFSCTTFSFHLGRFWRSALQSCWKLHKQLRQDLFIDCMVFYRPRHFNRGEQISEVLEFN